jgi:hypothetical protein
VLRTALSAVLSAVVGAMVLAGSLRAQTADQQGTLGEVSLPGGIAHALAAVRDPASPDRSQFLLEFIRRTYDAPLSPKGDPREVVLRSLLDAIKRQEAAAGSDTVPLPLPVRTWIDVVFAGAATPSTLVSAILQSRSAALLYAATLSLDDDTRLWLAQEPALIAEIVAKHSIAFVAAAPGLRISAGRVRLPGGELAAPVWEGLVGRSAQDPAAFTRSLLESGEGRLAYFFGAISQLNEPRLRLVLNLNATAVPARLDSTRRLYTVFQRLSAGRVFEQRAFTRPALDPALLAAELAVDADGRPSLPGTRAFWTAVFSVGNDADSTSAREAASRTLATDEPADFSWLCQQVFEIEGTRRHRYMMVMFASRRVGELTPALLADAIEAVRGSGAYPALTTALERAGVTSLETFAAATRRAAAIDVITDEGRAYRAQAQFQGALALVTHAAARGGLPPAKVTEFVSSLSAIPLGDRGDYEGRVACWLSGWLRLQPPPVGGTQPTAIAPGSAEEVIEGAAGPLERAAVHLLVGAPPAQPRTVDWEGTRYRVDVRRADATRITQALGDAPRPYLSAAEIIAAGADALGEAGLTRDGARFRQLSEEIAQAAQIDGDGGGDQPEAGEGPLARDRRVITSLQRAAKTGSVRAGVQLAPALRLIADQLLARGLMELAYAAALGQRDGLSISAADAVGRHDFGLRPILNRATRWRLPIAGSDAQQRWHVAGSLLNLDVGLAEFSLVRLSLKQPMRPPTLSDADRRSFIEVVALVAPSSLKDQDRDAIAAAIRRGRAAVERLRTPVEALALGDRAGLSAARRSLFAWIISYDATRSAAFLSPTELLWVGLEDGARPAALDAWGAPASAIQGCLCLRMVDRRPRELFTGRWNSGMIAAGFPDLNLRLAELLTELHMPAELLAPVLTSATLDFVNTAISRDPDDQRGPLEFVQGLRGERLEQYLALLTTDGPLVPIGETATRVGENLTTSLGSILGGRR